MGVEVAPDVFVGEFAISGFHGGAARSDAGVGALVVAFDIAIGDETAGIAKGGLALIDVDDGAELGEPEHLPGAAVVVAGPAAIEDVAEAEEAVGGSGGGKRLPGLILIARAAEHDDAVHLLMLGEACCSGAAVGGAGDDDSIPADAFSIGGDEVLPAALGVFFGKMTNELIGTLHHAIGPGDADGGAEVLASGSFEADVTDEVDIGGGGRFAKFSEPAIGIMDLDGVESVAVEALEEVAIVPHEPDHEPALRGDAGIDGGVLLVGGFAFLFEDEVDLGMLLSTGIDEAGASFEEVALGGGIGEGEGVFGVEEAAEEEGEEEGEEEVVFHEMSEDKVRVAVIQEVSPTYCWASLAMAAAWMSVSVMANMVEPEPDMRAARTPP